MDAENQATQNFVPGGFALGGHRTAPLTRDEQKQIIERGESVLWNNRIISSVSHLPSEAVLAVGDPAKEAAAKSSLQTQIDKLNAELEALKSGTLRAPAPAPGVGPGTQPVSQPRAAAPEAPAGLTAEQQEEIQAAQRKALLDNQRKETTHNTP